jgi:hypothetical protein
VTDRVARAVAAAVTVAGAHGVVSGDPVLLHDGANLVLHLRPASVVARVTTTTPALRPDIARPFTREVVLAAALTAADAAVVPPSDLLPPGPHRSDGLTLSFWRHVGLRPEPPTAGEAGSAPGELHEVLSSLPPQRKGSVHATRAPADRAEAAARLTAAVAEVSAGPAGRRPGRG